MHIEMSDFQTRIHVSDLKALYKSVIIIIIIIIIDG